MLHPFLVASYNENITVSVNGGAKTQYHHRFVFVNLLTETLNNKA
jgi:hypothetical protein